MLPIALLLVAVHPSWAEGETVRIGLFHMEPALGEMNQNTQKVQRAMALAKAEKVDWLVTPELALTGYRFARTIGTDWIKPSPDRYVQALQASAKSLEMVLFLGHLEQLTKTYDPLTERRYNTLFVIDERGAIVARHRKINTIPVSESWSTKGTEASVVTLGGLNVGLMICADAGPIEHAENLKNAGAQLIINVATWPPGEYGPGETWEKRSRETGLPLFVNNRTGIELGFDIRQAQSLVSYQGERLFSFAGDEPALVILDWDLANNRLSIHKIVRHESLL